MSSLVESENNIHLVIESVTLLHSHAKFLDDLLAILFFLSMFHFAAAATNYIEGRIENRLNKVLMRLPHLIPVRELVAPHCIDKLQAAPLPLPRMGNRINDKDTALIGRDGINTFNVPLRIIWRSKLSRNKRNLV
jgi:hypothetical protein